MAFLRLQVFAGEQAQVDWSHFGSVMIGRKTGSFLFRDDLVLVAGSVSGVLLRSDDGELTARPCKCFSVVFRRGKSCALRQLEIRGAGATWQSFCLVHAQEDVVPLETLPYFECRYIRYAQAGVGIWRRSPAGRHGLCILPGTLRLPHQWLRARESPESWAVLEQVRQSISGDFKLRSDCARGLPFPMARGWTTKFPAERAEDEDCKIAPFPARLALVVFRRA